MGDAYVYWTHKARAEQVKKFKKQETGSEKF